MQWLCLWFLLGAAAPAFAAPKKMMEENSPPSFLLNLRGGFLLNSPDRALNGRWEHKSAESYQVALSGFYTFPQAWRQLHFFVGPEFYYQSSKEEMAGYTYTSTINVSVYQFMLTGGIAWEPDWAAGWGASLASAFEAYGSKTATLDAQGFTQDLGTENNRPNGDFPVNTDVYASVYYKIGAFRPSFVIETNSSIGFGVAYAF